MHFPVYLSLGPWRLAPHPFFESLAYTIGFLAYLWLRRRYQDPIATPERWSVLTGAAAGGALGSKILFWLEAPQLTLEHCRDPIFLLGGKTIVGALIGGLIAVELVKRSLGERRSTGDLFAVPLAVGLAIGRVGCFLTGLADYTYGTPTSLPWGVDFGDGIPRHPVQLYEAIFSGGARPRAVQANAAFEQKTLAAGASFAMVFRRRFPHVHGRVHGIPALLRRH